MNSQLLGLDDDAIAPLLSALLGFGFWDLIGLMRNEGGGRWGVWYLGLKVEVEA